MAPPQRDRVNRKKDKFFVGKKNKEDKQKQHLEQPSNSGSFFVTPLEKQQILDKRGGKSKREQKSRYSSKSRTSEQSGPSDQPKVKKQFDKKKWRLQKYSKKYRLEQWEERRKKTVLHQYYRQIKDDEPKLDVQKIYEKYAHDDEDGVRDASCSSNVQEETENENNSNSDIVREQDAVEPATSKANTPQAKKRKAFKRAHLEYQRIQDEKRKRKEEIQRTKAEKANALKEVKQRKIERNKRLSKKTKRGQPIMKYRMEMLLEQIDKYYND